MCIYSVQVDQFECIYVSEAITMVRAPCVLVTLLFFAFTQMVSVSISFILNV